MPIADRDSKDESPLLTSVDHTMFLTNSGRDQVYEWIASGELQSFLEGKRRKVVVSSIHQLIERKLAGAKKFERARYPLKHAREAASHD